MGSNSMNVQFRCGESLYAQPGGIVHEKMHYNYCMDTRMQMYLLTVLLIRENVRHVYLDFSIV